MTDNARQEPSLGRRARPAGKASRRRKGDRQLDAVAWRVLDDLLRPDGAFAGLPAAGLEQLIRLRLGEEARRLGVAPERLAAAFGDAARELTGTGRLPPAPSGSRALPASPPDRPGASGADEEPWNEPAEQGEQGWPPCDE